jgi:hypothetical protein
MYHNGTFNYEIESSFKRIVEISYRIEKDFTGSKAGKKTVALGLFLLLQKKPGRFSPRRRRKQIKEQLTA